MTDWLLQVLAYVDLPVVILALLYEGLIVAGSSLRRLTGSYSCTPV
jgi:hypothetical protein